MIPPPANAPLTYDAALAYVEGLGASLQKLGLERMRRILASLDNPQDRIPSVHIAGSNGKGSVAAMLTGILKAAGLSVGTFTSPHLVHVRERIALNANPILPEDFAHETARLQAHLAAIDLPAEDWPTYFEWLNLMAIGYFARRNVDMAVIETGLGGRLDSTNTINHPNVTVITGISFDHAHILGDTLEKIAAEKAGILKPDSPLVLGPEIPAGALSVITARAAELGVPVTIADADRLAVDLSQSGLDHGLCVTDRHNGLSYRLALSGLYQRQNLATALSVIDCLRRQDVPIPPGALSRGIAQTHWPARFQVFKSRRVIVDGSHNAEGFAALGRTLAQYMDSQALYWLISLQGNRDPRDLLDAIRRFPRTQGVVCTWAQAHERYHAPEALRAALVGAPFPVLAADTTEAAFAQLEDWLAAHPQSWGLVTGSLYTAGQVLGEQHAVLV